jgi:DNA replication protein DnaC
MSFEEWSKFMKEWPETMGGDERLRARVWFSGIPPLTYFSMRLASYKVQAGSKKAFEYALAYSRGEVEHPFLTLGGKTGTGKTHLALGIAWEFLERGVPTVIYYHAETLLDAIRSGFSLEKDDEHGNLMYNARMKWLRDCELLIIDDLGAENQTDLAGAKLDEIVDYRYMRKLKLVVTTNIEPKYLPVRIVSRLQEGGTYSLEVPDWRQRGTKSGK